ncbi:MAG: hypothetical protein WC977_13520 [Anaerovoracaceae bacterium]
MSSYITPGLSRVYWVDAIADADAPEADEINLGTDLTAALKGLPAVPRTGNVADASTLDSTFEARRRGTVGGDQATFEIIRDDTTETEYESMSEGDEGYLVIFRKGIAGETPAADDVCDVYPAQVNAIADGTPGRNEVDYAVFELVITADPSRDVTVVDTSS